MASPNGPASDDISGDGGNGSSGADGGHAGNGGRGGDALGGDIYNAGRLQLSDTGFADSSATAGWGGQYGAAGGGGGAGGNGGSGASETGYALGHGGNGGNGGNGGYGGNGGNSGKAIGGAIYSTTWFLTDNLLTFAGGLVVAGTPGQGHDGGSGGLQGSGGQSDGTNGVDGTPGTDGHHGSDGVAGAVSNPEVFGQTVSPPVVALVQGGKLGTTTSVKVSWPAASDPSGIARYHLQQKTNTGAWTSITLVSPTATSVTVALAPGTKTHTFRVRATDGAGNTGPWATGTSFKLSLTQENATSVKYTGAFTRAALSGASGGYVDYASAAGRIAKFTFTGRSITFVGTKGPDRGKAEIWLDGVKVATLDLYTAKLTPASVLYAAPTSSGASHTLQVKVLGTKDAESTGTRIDIDAFLVVR